MGIVKRKISTRRPKSCFFSCGGSKYLTDKHLQRLGPPEKKLKKCLSKRICGLQQAGAAPRHYDIGLIQAFYRALKPYAFLAVGFALRYSQMLWVSFLPAQQPRRRRFPAFTHKLFQRAINSCPAQSRHAGMGLRFCWPPGAGS